GLTGRTGRGQLDRQPQPPRDAIPGFREVFREMTADGLVGMQGGERVDESEKLHPHERIIESCADEEVFPPGALPQPRPAAHTAEQLAADFSGPALERISRARRLTAGAGDAGAQGRRGSGATV